jgi:hypothetical protein
MTDAVELHCALHRPAAHRVLTRVDGGIFGNVYMYWNTNAYKILIGKLEEKR